MYRCHPFGLLALGLALVLRAAPAWADCGLPNVKQTRVTYFQQRQPPSPSDDYVRCGGAFPLPCNTKLQGILFEPTATNGKKPVIVFNHGSERMVPVSLSAEKCAIARDFTAAGFIVFVPWRRGHAGSTGAYVGDAPRSSTTALLHDQWRDVRDALEWVRSSVPDADPARIALAGHSYGAVVSLFANVTMNVERAVIAFSPGAETWKDVALQRAIVSAIEHAKAPVFALSPANDCNVDPVARAGPVYTIGQHVRAGSKAQVYPAFPSPSFGVCEEAHARFVYDTAGRDLWWSDVRAFLDANGAAP